MRLHKNKKGFTLIELLIVLVILGVIAGLAFPVLVNQIERSRAQEAIHALGTAKEAMVRYFNSNQSYLNATYATIGYTPGTGAGGQTEHFTYAEPVVNGAGTAYTITATRAAGVNGGLVANGTVVIDQSGDVTGTNLYAGI